jgi:hypothetical protein
VTKSLQGVKTPFVMESRGMIVQQPPMAELPGGEVVTVATDTDAGARERCDGALPDTS